MINNFLCDTCAHFNVCDKKKNLMKFHESAKKNLDIEITMDSCADYEVDRADGTPYENEDDEEGIL